MSGDGDPFPHLLKAPAVARLGSGKYRAIELDSVVTVTATEIAMSGISTRAELVHVPTFAPPIKYKLTVWETLPQLDNLIIGSATAFFNSPADEKSGVVQIEDATGIHDVIIERQRSSISIQSIGSGKGVLVEGVGRSLDEAVKDALGKAPPPAGADLISTLTVSEWGFRSGGFVGLSEYWIKGDLA